MNCRTADQESSENERGCDRTNWLVEVANKNSITLRLLSKSLGRPFSSGPPFPLPPQPFALDCRFLFSSILFVRRRSVEKMLDDVIAAPRIGCWRWLPDFPLFSTLSLSLSPSGGNRSTDTSLLPRPLFAVEHRVLHIYIPARPFTHLCFCVQINLRRVKNGKRQSFGVDSDCFIVFQVDMSSNFDKGSRIGISPSLRH